MHPKLDNRRTKIRGAREGALSGATSSISHSIAQKKLVTDVAPQKNVIKEEQRKGSQGAKKEENKTERPPWGSKGCKNFKSATNYLKSVSDSQQKSHPGP